MLLVAGIASAAAVACGSAETDADGPESAGAAAASAATSRCEATKADFAKGSVGFAAVQQSCNEAVSTYLDSQRENFDWFKNSPLGLGGPPIGLLLAMMDDREIWPTNSLGLFPNQTEQPAEFADKGLPFGMVYAANPETRLRHVFFSCAACHTGRVVGADGKIKMLHGAPNTEIEPQSFGWRVRESLLGRPGKEGLVAIVKDEAGNYVFDEQGIPKFTLTATGEKFKKAAVSKTLSLPGVFRGDGVEAAVFQLGWEKVMKKLVAGVV